MSEKLENELRRLVPVSPSAAMDRQIGAALRESSCWSDRVLRATLSAAMAASVLIVALLATDYPGAPPTAWPTTGTNGAAHAMTIADTPRLLAQLSSDRSVEDPARAAATNPN